MTIAYNLGFLASHGGSNMQAIVDACRSGHLPAVPRVLISNNADSGAMARAQQARLPAIHLSGRTHPDVVTLDAAILAALCAHEVNLVILAGYMRPLGPQVLSRYVHRILNIHPSLLPRHGGQGMYGERVHAAVLAAGDKETGATVHLVTARYDEGPVLAQVRVAVEPGDDIASLGRRVLIQEHLLYVETLQRIVAGAIVLPVTTSTTPC